MSTDDASRLQQLFSVLGQCSQGPGGTWGEYKWGRRLMKQSGLWDIQISLYFYMILLLKKHKLCLHHLCFG